MERDWEFAPCGAPSPWRLRGVLCLRMHFQMLKAHPYAHCFPCLTVFPALPPLHTDSPRSCRMYRWNRFDSPCGGHPRAGRPALPVRGFVLQSSLLLSLWDAVLLWFAPLLWDAPLQRKIVKCVCKLFLYILKSLLLLISSLKNMMFPFSSISVT